MIKKHRLTGEQEDARIQGLRLLARIIARHYLEHPDLYPALAGDSDGGGQGRAADTVRAGGDAARKEANQ